ncbi:MAG: SigB/SigF/SigG family RNA polymerase sigma factor [Clostridia bacterium]|nr:SigB/SigF/SigG family RNA polymerase sigma factor [Clostridia bacterium]
MNKLIWQAQNGSKEAMSTLIQSNVGLVWNVVKRFNNRGYEKEDLFQIGCIGLVKAIRRFDSEFETQLSTYAVPMIIGEIRRFIRDDGPIKVSRSLKELAYKIELLQSENVKNGKEQLSIQELSELLEVSKEEIVLSLESQEYIESLDRQIYDDDETTVADKILANKNEYDNVVDKLTIKNMMNVLDENEKKIIIYRYFKEKTQTEISKIIGVSQVQISRIEKRALDKMKTVS